NLGVEANRHLKQYQQAQHGDIEQLVGGYLIEVKNCAALSNMKAWWGQAVAAAEARDAVPCLAYKVARKGWRVRVPVAKAWATGREWRRELQYPMDLAPDGFYLLVRERL